MRMVGTMWTAHGLFVESLESALSGGGLLGRQVLRLRRLFIAVICANYGSSSSIMQNVCGPGCHYSPSGCCDSSFCFTVTRTRSSEERVLSTATFRTMLPFNPVSPACFDPLTVMM
jgi:hypothetical protein